MKKILMFLMLSIFLISLTSAFNIKTFDSNINNYGKIEIKDRVWYDPFGWFIENKIIEYTLEKNTDICLINCFAEGNVILYKDNKIFDGVEFKKLENNNKRKEVFISNNILILKNITYEIEELINNKTSIKKIQSEEWTNYSGEILESGTYQWRIEGIKKLEDSIDWIAISGINNIKLEEWAWWDSYPRGIIVYNDTGSHNWTVPEGVSEVEVLVVAGGGGGSRAVNNPGGAGGAGGVVYNSSVRVTPNTNVSVIVGEGGSGGEDAYSNGGNSTFGSVLAIGGGMYGKAGGSGGGGGNVVTTPGAAQQPTSTSGGYGYAGGGGYSSETDNEKAGGGGGGAGAVGQAGSIYQGGNGGIGRNYSNLYGISAGDEGYFGGGGGGISPSANTGIGGLGGGGNGVINGNPGDPSMHGMPNTGGGGGSNLQGGGVGAGNGGSGIVIITWNISIGINIVNPISQIYITDTFDLNYTATSTGTLDSCWYSLNLGETNSSRQNCGINWSSLIASEGANTWIVYGNDTTGKIGSNSVTFTINKFLENSITYNSSVQEMSYQSFMLNATMSADYTLNAAKLIYNNTQYTSTISSSGSNRIVTNAIEIPSVNVLQNKSFFWNLTLTDSESNLHYYDTSVSNQTVSPIFLGLCNSTYNMTTLNFTTKDEEDYHIVNNTINLNLNYYPQTGSGLITKTFSYQNLIEDTPYRSLCIYPETSAFKINGVVSYKSTGYDTRTFYFENFNINNVSQNIDLYLALIANSDIVTFAVVDDYDRSVSGATIVIEKWNVGENTYPIINTIITDSEGKASSNLILYETHYRFKVYYNNILYLTDGPYILSATTKNFKIYFTKQPDYSSFDNVIYNLMYNSSTNRTSFKWKGDSSLVTITQGCLTIQNITSNILPNIIYDNCFPTSIGEISVIVNSPGTFTAYGTISIEDADGNILSKIVDSITFSNNKPERYRIMESYGQAASFLIIGTVAVIGVAAGSIPLGMGLVVISLFFINWIGFLDLRAFIWSVVSLVIVILVVSIRRKR